MSGQGNRINGICYQIMYDEEIEKVQGMIKEFGE